VSERAAGEEQLLTGWAVLVEDRLEQLLADLAGDDGCPARLVEAMRHALLGGKHLRPLLALAACRACGGRAEESLDVACAVEMIHAYSLVHDDLPAMDDDDFRRGRPSCHRQFGEALAILAGDALLTWAFEILAKALGGEACTVAVALLARAAGPAGMVGGQADDISSWPEPPGQEAVESIARRKTGRLMGAAAGLGALAAAADTTTCTSMSRLGERLGLAFQIVDDLLAWHGESSRLGRPTDSDRLHQRPTHPRSCGPELSAGRVAELLREIRQELQRFTPGADALLELVALVEKRVP